MEQAMRNMERARALRIDSLVKAQPVKPAKRLQSYFAINPAKQPTKATRHRLKTAA